MSDAAMRIWLRAATPAGSLRPVVATTNESEKQGRARTPSCATAALEQRGFVASLRSAISAAFAALQKMARANDNLGVPWILVIAALWLVGCSCVSECRDVRGSYLEAPFYLNEIVDERCSDGTALPSTHLVTDFDVVVLRACGQISAEPVTDHASFLARLRVRYSFATVPWMHLDCTGQLARCGAPRTLEAEFRNSHNAAIVAAWLNKPGARMARTRIEENRRAMREAAHRLKMGEEQTALKAREEGLRQDEALELVRQEQDQRRLEAEQAELRRARELAEERAWTAGVEALMKTGKFLFLDRQPHAEVHAPDFGAGECRAALTDALEFWHAHGYRFHAAVQSEPPVRLYAHQVEVRLVPPGTVGENVAGLTVPAEAGGHVLLVTTCDWQLLAHELGHALGERHTLGFYPGNIMHPQTEFVFPPLDHTASR